MTQTRSRAIASDRATLGSRHSIACDSHQSHQQHAGAASADECEQGPTGRNHGICPPSTGSCRSGDLRERSTRRECSENRFSCFAISVGSMKAR